MSQQPAASLGNLTDRQSAILALIESNGFVTIENLAGTFEVSAQSVRRDIIALDKAGLVQRFHGGAGSNGAGDETLRLGHERKRLIAIEAKARIARKVYERVPDGAAIFLDVGTTVEAAAEILNGRENLQVFTNNVRAALCFDPTRHNVQILGGRLSGQDGSLTGADTVLALSALRLDIALIGCSGIEADRCVMDFDPAKIAIKQTAMRVSKSAYLLAAREKYDRTARAEVALLNEFVETVSED